ALPLAQFSRKVKHHTINQQSRIRDPTASEAAAADVNDAATSAAAAAVVASAATILPASGLTAAHVRAAPNQALEVAFAGIDKLTTLREQLRRKMCDEDFVCSRDSIVDINARLEVMKHLLTDVVHGRRDYDRQGLLIFDLDRDLARQLHPGATCPHLALSISERPSTHTASCPGAATVPSLIHTLPPSLR
ncbi:hypothetical protein CF335_g8923, partial [Tilletia laevis]